MGFLSDLFGGGKKNNPANSAMPYLNQIPGRTSPYMQPYIGAGNAALTELQPQYHELLNRPGEKLNAIGGSFQQSPGFQFALQQALQGSNNAASAGGMAGTPQHEFQNMDIATGLANQDYYNWLDKSLGLFGQGMQGEQGMAGLGAASGNNMANMIAQTLAQQGNLAFQGQRQENQNRNDLFGNIFNGAGALAAFNPWGLFGKI